MGASNLARKRKIKNCFYFHKSVEIVQILPIYLLPNALVELIFPASSLQMLLSIPEGFTMPGSEGRVKAGLLK